MSMSMFAAYDRDGVLEPQYFPLEVPTEQMRAIWTRLKDLGVGKVTGEYPKSIIGVDGDAVLVHFGYLIRFLDGGSTKMLAAYADESSDQDQATLLALGEQAVINPGFMSQMWEYRPPRYLKRVQEVSPPQEHLHIALVTDMLDLSVSASAAIDSEVSA
ncbi:MAG: hypothetical protein ACTIBG_05965 [Brevibacterium aurantiacum]|uniref:hypothetical protein n=1 Tax=Brevibacterium aurantiacum TaxID=273384 RepID=UPI003F8FB870